MRDDLKAEVILIVCEMDAEKVIGLHQRKELEFYVVRIILNLVQSNTSPFVKKYRKANTEIEYMKDHPFESINEICDRADREEKEDRVIGEIDNLHWYNAALVKLYMELGNYRAIAVETKIPVASCYKNIRQSFQELKASVK